MAESLVRTQLDWNEPAGTLIVTGELDVSSGPTLEHAVARALDGQGGEFRLDLRGLTFMDSTGARSLVRVHRRLDSIGRRLVLLSPTRSVKLVIELLGLDELMEVRE